MHRKRILFLLSERPDGTLTAAEVLRQIEERFGHLHNRVDMQKHSGGVKKWITRARKSSSLMVQEGLIERPALGIWRLTAQGWAEARRIRL